MFFIYKQKTDTIKYLLFQTGNDLLSRAASRQVSSALRSLTAVFEMGTGVSSALLSPDFVFDVHFQFLSQTVTNLFLRYTLKSE